LQAWAPNVQILILQEQQKRKHEEAGKKSTLIKRKITIKKVKTTRKSKMLVNFSTPNPIHEVLSKVLSSVLFIIPS